MSIFVGDREITGGELKIGSQDIQEVYVGDQKIWPPYVPNYVYYANVVPRETGKLLITNRDVGGVYIVDNMNNRTDIPDDSSNFEYDVQANSNHNIYFDTNTVVSSSFISFQNTNIRFLVTIKSLGSLTSLRSLVANSSAFQVTFNPSTAQIVDWSYAYCCSDIELIPEAEYDEATNVSMMFSYLSALNQELIELDFPKATIISGLFSNNLDVNVNRIVLNLGVTIFDAKYAFQGFNNLAQIYINLDVTGGHAEYMFESCTSLICITGLIHTEYNAVTTGMFDDTPSLVEPDAAAIADLTDANGGYWTNEECDDLALLLDEVLLCIEVDPSSYEPTERVQLYGMYSLGLVGTDVEFIGPFVRFNGVSSYTRVEKNTQDEAIPKSDNFTFAFWMMLDSDYGINDEYTIAAKWWDNDGRHRVWRISKLSDEDSSTPGHGRNLCLWMSNNGDNYERIFSDTELQANHHYHVVIVKMGNKVEFYFDGVSEGYKPTSITTLFQSNQDDNRETLGATAIASADPNANYYKGLLSQFAIWDRAFSADDVLFLFNEGVMLPFEDWV